MQTHINIEHRESGPAHLDKTADPEIGYEAAYAAALGRHAESFDACDLTECVDDRLLALVKAGSAEAAGRYLIDAYRARIGDLADWSMA